MDFGGLSQGYVFFEVIVKRASGYCRRLGLCWVGKSPSVIPVTPYSAVDLVTRDTDTSGCVRMYVCVEDVCH